MTATRCRRARDDRRSGSWPSTRASRRRRCRTRCAASRCLRDAGAGAGGGRGAGLSHRSDRTRAARRDDRERGHGRRQPRRSLPAGARRGRPAPPPRRRAPAPDRRCRRRPALEVELALELADRRVDALIVSPIGPSPRAGPRSPGAFRRSVSASACRACRHCGSGALRQRASSARRAGAPRRARAPADRRALLGDRARAPRAAPSRPCSKWPPAPRTRRRSCTPASTASTARIRSRGTCSTAPRAPHRDLRALGFRRARRVRGLPGARPAHPGGRRGRGLRRPARLAAARSAARRACAGTPTASPRSPSAWPSGASEEAALARTAIVPPALHARGSTG